tara:strand:- start:305 stop:1147 length:843 start_codon:yes stop_codon:yes gene_type:complete
MYCLPGKAVSAADVNEARTWYVASHVNRDPLGKYLKDLRVYWDEDKKPLPFCVFSGNLKDEDMNRLPDILLDTEYNDFKTGLFELPVRFQRIFLKNHYSDTEKKHFQSGDSIIVDPNKLNNALKLQSKQKHKEIKDNTFLSYLLKPGTLNTRPYSSLDFVVVPTPEYYWSYSKLLFKTGANMRKKDELPKSIPNTKNKKEVKIIKNIVNGERGNEKGLYLSDVIHLLKNKHPNSFITLIVTACRIYHPDLTTNLRNNQEKTAQINVDTYLKQYASKDIGI